MGDTFSSVGTDDDDDDTVSKDLRGTLAGNCFLKVLESVTFFLGGKKCQKIVNIEVMRKDRAAQQRLFGGTILRGLTHPLHAYGYKYKYLSLLLFYPIVVPADLSQQVKSAAADGHTYSDSIDKKVLKI
jgi:hypothetical protein